jgi:hypothetical protein
MNLEDIMLTEISQSQTNIGRSTFMSCNSQTIIKEVARSFEEKEYLSCSMDVELHF